MLVILIKLTIRGYVGPKGVIEINSKSIRKDNWTEYIETFSKNGRTRVAEARNVGPSL